MQDGGTVYYRTDAIEVAVWMESLEKRGMIQLMQADIADATQPESDRAVKYCYRATPAGVVHYRRN